MKYPRSELCISGRNWDYLFQFFLFQMREIRHDNLTPFIGACVESVSRYLRYFAVLLQRQSSGKRVTK